MTTLDLTLAELEFLVLAAARESGALWRRALQQPAPAGLADKLDAALDAADGEATT